DPIDCERSPTPSSVVAQDRSEGRGKGGDFSGFRAYATSYRYKCHDFLFVTRNHLKCATPGSNSMSITLRLGAIISESRLIHDGRLPQKDLSLARDAFARVPTFQNRSN